MLERRHSDRFRSIMDAHLPQWPTYRELLNGLPLAHEDGVTEPCLPAEECRGQPFQGGGLIWNSRLSQPGQSNAPGGGGALFGAAKKRPRQHHRSAARGRPGVPFLAAVAFRHGVGDQGPRGLWPRLRQEGWGEAGEHPHRGDDVVAALWQRASQSVVFAVQVAEKGVVHPDRGGANFHVW